MTQAIKDNKDRRIIPNNAFDIEYRTEWRDEVDFLAERGIYYTIRKKEGEYQIPVYKYTKTADLFIALADFYLRRKRNMRSQATYRNPKYEQQSFLNKDGSIKEKFDNTINEKSNYKKFEEKKAEMQKPTAEEIEAARKILAFAGTDTAEENTINNAEPQDDTE